MKKYGFTLAELLITLSIIGIGAALMVPALSNITPDKNKARVLRYYTNISNAAAEILDDDTIYWNYIVNDPSEPDKIGTPNCIGLACQEAPREGSEYYDNEDEKYQGTEKFQNLMINKLGLTTKNNTHSLPDGSKWTFTDDSEGQGTAWTISVNINGKTSTCTYDEENCGKSANLFEFEIDKFGKVSPKDSLTKAYLKNPTNMNNKKEDLKEAEKIKSESPVSEED